MPLDSDAKKSSAYLFPPFWLSVSADSCEDNAELSDICLANLSIRLARNIRCLIELAQEIKITPRQTMNNRVAQM